MHRGGADRGPDLGDQGLAAAKDLILVWNRYPAKALEGLRNALAANPYNSRAYAWALVISYNSGRYGEMKTALGRRLFRAAERALCDSPLRVFAGFYVAAIEKRS